MTGERKALTVEEIKREKLPPGELKFILGILRRCPGVTVHKGIGGGLVFRGIRLKEKQSS
jgi:hypothetical protein